MESDEPRLPRSPTGPRATRYGMSCVGCRKRKQKCDGRAPACTRCLRLKEQCVYESNVRNQPSPQVVSALSNTVHFLESLVSTESTQADSELRPAIRNFLSSMKIPNFATRQVSFDTAEIDSKTPREDDTVEEGTTDVDELLMHMSLAEDGQNGHFGVTSLFYQTPSESVVERLQRRSARLQTSPSEHRSSPPWPLSKRGEDDDIWVTEDRSLESEEEGGILRANASMLSGWESLAYHKLELETDMANAKMVVHLLKVYFCWQYGSHCVVYRPVFIRDMALGGPYFNHFLLNVICAHATRYSDYHSGSLESSNGFSTPALALGADFMSRAKLLLASEMDKPSSIPTIQGLLLLGQRECACGNHSQGWMYTGMAFRAMRDLGIHLDCNRLPIFGFGTLSSEDREIRRRLFWSAYTWDKIISLALGRMPTFNAWQNVSPGPIIDDTEDDTLWTPYFWEDRMPVEMLTYLPQKSLMTLNFRHFIKLSEIIQKIIMRLYGGRPNRMRNIGFVEQMKTRLSGWMQDLPVGIRMDANNLPDQCPPPHIFSTNALYRAAWILLYRIFLPSTLPLSTAAPADLTAEAVSTCTKMADELHQLFVLYAKTFKLRNMTYTLSWSMYSAATINAIDFHSADPIVSAAASPRLSMSLHVLERGSLQTPGTKRSIDIIKQRLRSPSIPRPKRPAQESDRQVKRFNAESVDQELPNTVAEVDWSTLLTTDQPVVEQQSQDEELLGMWLQMMQGSGGTSMDLLQGMMAMPATSAGTGNPAEFADWEPAWGTQ